MPRSRPETLSMVVQGSRAAACALATWLAAGPAQGAPSPEASCFGGVPQTVVEREAPGPIRLAMNGRHLYWWTGQVHPAFRLDLSTGAIAPADQVDLGPMDEREVFFVGGRNTLLGVDLQTGAARRVLALPIVDPIHWSSLGLDAQFVYFATVEGPRRRPTESGLFRVRRDGSQPPEQLALEPTGEEPFQVHAGFAYWSRWKPSDPVGGEVAKEELVRRALKPDAPLQIVVASVELPTRVGGYSPQMRFAQGRVYYLDRNALWSAPLAGGRPTRHVAVGNPPDVSDLIVEPPCAYWTIAGEVRRALLAGGRPQILARVPAGVYSLATDGRHLYWADTDPQGGRIVRVGRPGQAKPFRSHHLPPPPPPPAREVRPPAPSDPTVFGTPTYFNGGKPLPPGRYVVRYVDGCMKYNDFQGWTVNAYEGEPASWWIVGDTVAQRKLVPPGNVGFVPGKGGFARFEDCVKASKTAPPRAFDHAGGKLGVWLQDGPYDDNVPGEKGRNPTWQVTLAGPRDSSLSPNPADAGAPPPEPPCHYEYAQSIVCHDNPAFHGERELYVLSAINNKLRHFPAFAAFASAAGIRCVRECSTARRYMTLYQEYSAAHPGFDAAEPLELPF